MKKMDFGKLMEKKRFAMVISILIAVIAWFIVAIQFDPEISETIHNVPVHIDVTGTVPESYGLDVVAGQESLKVDVEIHGKRYKTSMIKASDFDVTVNLAQVTKAGTYQLDVTATQKSMSNEYQIRVIKPDKVTVRFDNLESKELQLEAQAPNIEAKEGFIKEKAIVSPSTLKVQGPKDDVAKISKAVVITDKSEKTNTTVKTAGTLHLYDEGGNELDQSVFKNIPRVFEMTVPIYKVKTVPLKFTYTNLPSTFDVSKLQYTMSHSEITIAGTGDAVDNLGELNLGNIDVRDIDVGKTFTFDIGVPAGFTIISDYSQVTVDFSSNDLKSILINVRNINPINIPAGFTVTVVSTEIKNVKAVGNADVISAITADDFMGSIDLMGQALNQGTQTVPVRIDVLQKDGVWVVGEYASVISVTK